MGCNLAEQRPNIWSKSCLVNLRAKKIRWTNLPTIKTIMWWLWFSRIGDENKRVENRYSENEWGGVGKVEIISGLLCNRQMQLWLKGQQRNKKKIQYTNEYISLQQWTELGMGTYEESYE